MSGHDSGEGGPRCAAVFRFGRRSLAGARAADRVFVPVSGLKSDDGVVRCGLYDTAGAFPKAGQESRGGHRQD